MTLRLLLLIALFTTPAWSDDGKGIVEADPQRGFKLSPEALKNFAVTTVRLVGKGPWKLPVSAVVTSGEETNVVLLREEFFKSLDFIISKREGLSIWITSELLREGDEIVVTGLGYLKIVEIAASGGAVHGHSH